MPCIAAVDHTQHLRDNCAGRTDKAVQARFGLATLEKHNVQQRHKKVWALSQVLHALVEHKVQQRQFGEVGEPCIQLRWGVQVPAQRLVCQAVMVWKTQKDNVALCIQLLLQNLQPTWVVCKAPYVFKSM